MWPLHQKPLHGGWCATFRTKCAKGTFSQDIKFLMLAKRVSLTAGFPITFISMRQLTKTWIWTSCRDACIWTCQERKTGKIWMWLASTDMFTHDSFAPVLTHFHHILLTFSTTINIYVFCFQVHLNNISHLTLLLTKHTDAHFYLNFNSCHPINTTKINNL